MEGLFITFEGVDGCGKSTQTRFLSEYLMEKGYNVLVTREPGGCEIAEKIRELLLDINNEEMDDKTEALLYAAARAQHVEQIIKPAVKQGKIVLCDRFIDSSLAYQGVGRNLGIKNVFSVNKFGIGDLMPNKTFFLDFPPHLAFERMKKKQKFDRIETQSEEFYIQLYNGFLQLIEYGKETNNDRIIKIDVSGTKFETHEIIKKEMDKLL